ncbi:MAG: hypothetical protein BWK78_02605 [Thiotrichaceae bacterium IS1]|nr:MAG: hypothetical protein BWK78_02605 [Thiotrichaceae bacterium IS1]
MPTGICESDLKMESLSEEMLTGKRIRHLVNAGMVTRNDTILQVTLKGKLVVGIFKIYRRVMNLPPYGKG